jgi:hypothetical protein
VHRAGPDTALCRLRKRSHRWDRDCRISRRRIQVAVRVRLELVEAACATELIIRPRKLMPVLGCAGINFHPAYGISSNDSGTVNGTVVQLVSVVWAFSHGLLLCSATRQLTLCTLTRCKGQERATRAPEPDVVGRRASSAL